MMPVSSSSSSVWEPARSRKSRSYVSITRGAGARGPAWAAFTASAANTAREVKAFIGIFLRFADGGEVAA